MVTQHPIDFERRRLLRAVAVPAVAALAAGGLSAQANDRPRMTTRPIPSSGEALPVIGCGTYIGFDQAADSAAYALLPGVVDALLDAGGKVFDSSPMYGRAEAATGELLTARGRRAEAFLATKVWTTGRKDGVRQLETSMRLLRTDRIDLMQVHNLLDWRTQLATMRRWKGEGRLCYLGVSHYTASAYAEVAAVRQPAVRWGDAAAECAGQAIAFLGW